MEGDTTCIICKKDTYGTDSAVLQAKGASAINICSQTRRSDVVAVEGSRVHIDCRKRFTDKRKLQESNVASASRVKRTSRLTAEVYDPKIHCLFCGTNVDFSNKHGPLHEPQKVRTKDFGQTMKQCSKERSDEWSFSVSGRIQYFIADLHAADCVYHQSCSVNFRTGRRIPEQYMQEICGKKQKLGRPQNEHQVSAFLQTCSYFQSNDEEQLTILDLISVMEKFLEGSDVSAYDRRHMKRKLIEHFGESIIISGSEGLTDVVTLRESADVILRQYYGKDKDVDVELQKILIVEAAAKIIKSDIKSAYTTSRDTYPGSENLNTTEGLNYLPNSLRLLLSKTFVGKDIDRKVASIGQCIMQCARPRSILAPFQLGLTVQLHHHFRSRYLIDTLHALGFSASYNDALQFERNAALVSSTSLPLKDNSHVVMVGDNVDHNLCTLDGKNTIHVMGMIAAVSPYSQSPTAVTRRKIQNDELLQLGKIDIQEYRASSHILKSTVFVDLPFIAPKNGMLDRVWQISGYLKPGRAQWSGTMQVVFGNEDITHTGEAVVKFLPMIDLIPSDMTCILSTLKFLFDLANKNHIPAVITFDQPLFWKASMIKLEYDELKSIVLQLGNFHTIMNLLGAVGSLMEGSGLSEVFEKIYAGNAVPHLISGKAYSRAIRGHLIVDAALHTNLIEYSFPSDEGKRSAIFDNLLETYDKLMEGSIHVKDLESNESLKEVCDVLDSKKSELRSSSRTSILWLEYQSAVATIRKLITADRLGSFPMLLESLTEALPIFAASGHTNYTKSVYLHLQNMTELHNTHPEIYAVFNKGGHVIR